jgi:hypothetical protein
MTVAFFLDRPERASHKSAQGIACAGIRSAKAAYFRRLVDA